LASAVFCFSCYPQRGTVGAQFGRDADGHTFVRDVPPGLGAAKAGIRDGDEVLLIDGRDVRTLSDVEIHRILSGERGSYVRLTLVRGKEIIRTAVERTPPPAPSKSTQ
jgi:C-terminal processing protease CtpA/Prc